MDILDILRSDVDVTSLHLIGLLCQVHLDLTLAGHEVELNIGLAWSRLQCSRIVFRHRCISNFRLSSIVECQNVSGLTISHRNYVVVVLSSHHLTVGIKT